MSEFGHINLRVIKFLEGRTIKQGVIARLKLNRGDSPNIALDERRKKVVVSIGDNPEPLSIKLVSGWWSVDIELPGGQSLQRDFKLEPEAELDVTLEVEGSPREFLAWQHYSGAVSGKVKHLTPAPKRSQTDRKRSRPKKRAAKRMSGLESAGGNLRHFRKAIRKEQINRVMAPTDDFLDDIAFESVHTDDFAIDDDELDFAIEDVAETIRESNAAGNLPLEEITVTRFKAAPSELSWENLINIDGDFGAHPFNNFPPVSAEKRSMADIYEVFRFSGDGSFEGRNWAHISGFGERRLISIPAPWPGKYQESDDSEFEILIHFLKSEQGLAQLFIKDSDTAALLAYLTRDKLSEALLIADQAKDWLFEKYSNPLAAAAGGYVMLATHLDSDDQDWMRWIKNLSRSFDRVPDGKILEGSMYLNGRKGIRDFDKAADCFKIAYERGLPFFTLGFSWLSDGLSMLETRYPELAPMQKNVRRISRMIETQRPFTTIQLPAEPDD